MVAGGMLQSPPLQSSRMSFAVFVYGPAGIGIEQSIHDYPTPLITINLPLANFFLGAPAAFANIVGI